MPLMCNTVNVFLRSSQAEIALTTLLTVALLPVPGAPDTSIQGLSLSVFVFLFVHCQKKNVGIAITKTPALTFLDGKINAIVYLLILNLTTWQDVIDVCATELLPRNAVRALLHSGGSLFFSLANGRKKKKKTRKFVSKMFHELLGVKEVNV